MWKFKTLQDGQAERSPHEAEFFNVGDLDPSAALVRESIQNSLDARMSDVIEVRFSFSNRSFSEDEENKYYADVIKHLKECPIGKNYSSGDSIPFLLIEDFGTKGLDGYISRGEAVAGITKSNYYNFWWREGISGKTGQAAGRWGLGKTVYYGCSRLRSFWGLTIRHDDSRELLFGKSLLQAHKFDNEIYDYSAYFTTDDSYKPIEDEDLLIEFRDHFRVTRSKEAGLSLIIPQVVPEITPQAIVRSVIIHYFFPIIKGTLVVKINDGKDSIALNRSSLCEQALKQDWSGTPWEDRSVEALMHFIEESRVIPEDRQIVLQKSCDMPKMTEALFGDKLENARQLFAENNLLAIRVPVTIELSDNPSGESFFDIFIQKSDEIARPEEFYIRSGITISEIKMLKHNVRALLLADDEPISRFLGDSESPAHTDWKERTEQFQQKYQRATQTLRFIRSSLREVARILDVPPPGRDVDFLKDIFFLEDTGGELPTGVEPPVPPDIPPTRPVIFAVTKIDGGFRIALTEQAITPIEAIIRVAYSVRKGNPFTKYHRFDFDFESGKLSGPVKGGQIVKAYKNEIHIKAESNDFNLRVSGFDRNRDIVVVVKEQTI